MSGQITVLKQIVNNKIALDFFVDNTLYLVYNINTN